METGKKRPSRVRRPSDLPLKEDLCEFICSCPLVKKLGLSSEMIAASMEKWTSCAFYLSKLFDFNEGLPLPLSIQVRFYHFYIPVFMWCENMISKYRSCFKHQADMSPLVIGISAPQGCGKSTLVHALSYLFQVTGRKSATLSSDDLYLTWEGQVKLREENYGNPLLEFRGNAGTHDLTLSYETLAALSKITKQGMMMKLPRYDKSAHNGWGDRCDPSAWPEVEGPLTVILFEGWMLGFKPLSSEVARGVDPQLEAVNKNLEGYYDAWEKFINAWILIKIEDLNCVFQWRLQAEIAQKEAGKPGMTDAEVIDFVSRYMPAYRAYLPVLYEEGPNGSDPENILVIDIDKNRNPC